jgi:NitT/TauT family transport system substrate-binding protein
MTQGRSLFRLRRILDPVLRRLGFLLGMAGVILAGESQGVRAETITVTHWGGQFYGVPYAVAMEKGFFKKNGVDVTGILTAAGGGTAVRNTLAGGIPFGEVSLAAAVQAINPARSLSSSAQGPGRSPIRCGW